MALFFFLLCVVFLCSLKRRWNLFYSTILSRHSFRACPPIRVSCREGTLCCFPRTSEVLKCRKLYLRHVFAKFNLIVDYNLQSQVIDREVSEIDRNLRKNQPLLLESIGLHVSNVGCVSCLNLEVQYFTTHPQTSALISGSAACSCR